MRSRMTVRLVVATVALLFAGQVPGSARGAEAGSDAALATVVNRSGTVQLRRAGAKPRPVGVGAQLRAGDVLTTGPKSWVWLLYGSGQMKKLGPKSRLSFGASNRQRATKKSGITRLLARLFGNPETAELSTAGGGIRPAAHQAFFVLSPRRSYVLDAAPELRWTRVKGATRYRIKVASIAKDILTRETAGCQLDLAREKQRLPRGQLYFLTVEAMGKHGKQIARDRTTFTVASDVALTDLKRLSGDLKKTVGRDNFSHQVVLAELYLQKTFYADALRLLQRLHKQRPDVPWLARRIATTRRLIGLPAEGKKR